MAVDLGSAFGQIILDASGVLAGTAQADGALGSLASGLGNVGKALTTKVTLPLVGVGAVAAKVATDFEGQMATLSIAARSSGTSLDTLSAAALKTGADTSLVGISAAESAEAMENLYKAGLNTGDIFGNLNGYMNDNIELGGALRASVDLQAASELELANASELVAITMATFGLEADDAGRIVDSFVQSADASVTSVGELGDAMINVGPLAASLGWSLEETNTALAILSERGISGAEAGTNLKSMMLNLMKQTDPVTDALRELNIALFDSAGQMKGLPVILGELEGAMAGMTQEQKQYYIQTLAGSYGQAAMNTLLEEGSAGWAEMEAGIAGAATAQEVATAKTDTFSGAMEALQGTIETLMIQAGTPLINEVLRPAVEWLTETVGWFAALSPEVQRLGVGLGLLLAGIGPVLSVGSALVGVISTLAGGAGAVVAGFVGLAAAASQVGAGLALIQGGAGVFAVAGTGAAGLTAALLPVVVALGAVTAAYLKWNDVQDRVAEGTAKVSDAWDTFFEEQVESGASAAEVLDAYRGKQELVREELDKGGVAADLLIRNQGELINSDRELAVAVARTARDYGEFLDVMAEAGVETEISAETFAHLQAGTSALGESIQGLKDRMLDAAQGVLAMSRDAAASDQRMLAFAASATTAAGAVGAVEAEVAAVVGAMMEMDDILAVTQEAFAATGLEGAALEGAMLGAEIAMGTVSEADAKLQADVTLVAAAFAEGSLSAAAYNDYMGQAAAGTLNLSAEQQAGIGNALAHAQAQREGAAASDEYRLALLQQSEALMDVGAQQAAQIALSGLQAKFEAGLLSLDQYEAATINVQDAYGLATPQSRALADAITILNDGLASGAIAPQEYADAIEAARAAAEEGESSVEGLLGAVEDAVGPFQEGKESLEEYGSSASTAAGETDTFTGAVDRANAALVDITSRSWNVDITTTGNLPAAAGGAVPLAVGAWDVPEDMLALIHEGEMVVPADEAEMMRATMLGAATPSFVQPSVAGAGVVGVGMGDTYIEVTIDVERIGDDVDVQVLAYQVARAIQERQRR